MSAPTTRESAGSERVTAGRRRLPGVEGVWVLVGVDSAVFALLFACFMQARLAEPDAFASSHDELSRHLGGANTLILLTSSWLVALAVLALRAGDTRSADRRLTLAVVAGLAFVSLKGFEYADKVAHGITPATDDFFMWYFALTGIHLVHVLIGLCLLLHVRGRVRGHGAGRDLVVVECVATFWHLVDYVWIVLFPLLYLMEGA